MRISERNSVISITNGTAVNPVFRFKEPVNLRINRGEQVAIIGPNGSGKSLLVNTLTGQYPLLDNNTGESESKHGLLKSGKLRLISFHDSYGSADSTYYYQQRWNTTEIDDYLRIKDLFPVIEAGKWKDELFDLFSLNLIWERHIVSLSGGEMRKFQLAKALSVHPEILIIDNPFIGLDQEARDSLCLLLDRLIKEWDMQVIFVISRPEDIAPFITHIIHVEKMICGPKKTLAQYIEQTGKQDIHTGLPDYAKKTITSLEPDSINTDEIVNCRKVSLKYGNRTLFDKLDWLIRKGEKWSLLGPNGSGKSALLSLIYADNPQSYANDIALFGKKRGTGESIWDIKRRIGYVSPEMHRSYVRHLPVIDVIASGLHDSIGLYKKSKNNERDICKVWMNIFGIGQLAERDFFTLSSGEQRLALLTRAFVKNPSLLILDEPLHGLDAANRTLVMGIIETFCVRPDKTLIMVTHYPEELPGYIDHSLVLQRQN